MTTIDIELREFKPGDLPEPGDIAGTCANCGGEVRYLSKPYSMGGFQGTLTYMACGGCGADASAGMAPVLVERPRRKRSRHSAWSIAFDAQRLAAWNQAAKASKP